MITKVILLFLLGTVIASEHFMKKLQPQYEVAVVLSYKSSGCPAAADWAPIICKFLQTNMDLYYKPQLIAPSTYIPPLVVQKCDTREIKVDLELPTHVEERNPILIPQPPELPPLTIPKFPVPVIVEEFPKKVNEPSDSPEMPLIHIPEAPQLPELAMPVRPQIFEQPEPYFFKEAIPEIDNNGIDEKPMVLPQPPELPEYTIPEFPVHMEIPSESVLPVMDIPKPYINAQKPEEPRLNEKVTPEIDYNLVKFEPMSIPQPPELPDFVMPELPAIPTYFENKPIAYSPIQAEFKPLAILPAAPELPPAKLPELTVSVEIPSAPVLPPADLSQPIVVVEQPNEEPYLKEGAPKFDSEYTHIVIPQPPELPAFVMPELSTLSFRQEPIKTYYKPLASLPAAPELPAVNLPESPFNVEIPSAPLPTIDILFHKMAEEQTLPEVDYNMIYKAPISIPAPPQLPVFVMPEFPLNLEREPIKTYYEPLAPLSAAPELPEANLPEFPVNVEVSAAPDLPEIDTPSPTMAEEQPLLEVDNNMIYRAPISIPAPPQLPAFVMPELHFNLEQEPIKTNYEPLARLPVAPELPAANLPVFPVNVEIPSAPALPEIGITSITMAEEQPLPEIDSMINSRAGIEIEAISIPAPPELPAFKMPELPFKIEEPPMLTLNPKLPSAPKLFEFKPNFPTILPTFINKPCEPSGKLEVESDSMPNTYFQRYFNEKVKDSHNIMIPTKPMNLEYVPCVYNLVLQHVLPNIASDHLRSLEKIETFPTTLQPCA